MTDDAHDDWSQQLDRAIKREQREEWHKPTYGRPYQVELKQKPLSPSERGTWPSGWWIMPVALVGLFLWVLIGLYLF